MQTAKELVAACLNAAKNYKTLYVMGCFGAPMTDHNKTRYLNGYAFNRKPDRAEKIHAATADTFGFDCVCFIKALLWGWTGDPGHVYGGAAYKANGIPDMGADAMLKACTQVSEDFSVIVPGEFLWLPGHCGIYVGDGLAAEATFEPEEGVQLQCVLPMGVKPGMAATGWVKHGKLPWIRYEEDPARYRVILEGLTKREADNFAADPNWRVRVEELGAEQAPAEPTPGEGKEAWEPAEGDTVYFTGGMQYSQSNAAAGSKRAAGQARITKTAPGALHPYHLVKTGKSGPYGWVDRDTFEKER